MGHAERERDDDMCVCTLNSRGIRDEFICIYGTDKAFCCCTLLYIHSHNANQEASNQFTSLQCMHTFGASPFAVLDVTDSDTASFRLIVQYPPPTASDANNSRPINSSSDTPAPSPRCS